jgi:hypothetical protein
MREKMVDSMPIVEDYTTVSQSLVEAQVTEQGKSFKHVPLPYNITNPVRLLVLLPKSME